MERIKLLVVALVFGALGLLALRLWSGSSSIDEASDYDDGDGTRLARRTDDGTVGSSSGPRLGRNRGVNAAAREEGDNGDSGYRPGSGSSRGSDGFARRSGADVIGGDRRGSGGSVGVASGGSALRGKLGAGFGASGAAAVHSDGSSTGGGHESRSDLVDALAAQPKSSHSNNSEFGAQMGAEDKDSDVLLAVNKPEDTDNAVENKNVKPSEDGDGISFKDGSNVAFPADLVNADAGSISFKIEPETWKGSDATDNSFVQIRDPNQWDNRLQIFRNGIYLRFIFTDNTSVESGISYKIDNWEPGETHPITATWGDGTIHMYVDGQEVGQNTYNGTIGWGASTNMHLGSDVPGGFNSAGATIKDFKVYGRALSSDEVAR